jgi:hypothetical protein
MLNLPSQNAEAQPIRHEITALGEAVFIDCIPAKKVTASGNDFGWQI